MGTENVIKINARGLSNPGPRMMVQTALEKGKCTMMRVVVSSADAASDLEAFFRSCNAKVEIDAIGEEFHILADFTALSESE
ncbi:MAG: hypothetical protein GTO51_06605 [Candidatus Latescibacteria bacterium]|nr:hypothetical protein [Candidatus Latescibacterota bacterium]NIM21473.1 hypothetical protein [Candidatus Latescibacterota bacterium]NIM65644.1 hypothetical protein [Candidatus Latescibacterota bacterium]NIO02026.1 hypothetical protein [Candidatus Latescibacterota bacterium]NIO28838.1 hypothetical protein [Candidatus Latescibacterota bacterium]